MAILDMGGIYEIDGKKIVQFGGRANGTYELGPNEDAIWIPTKGEVYTPTGDLIIAIIYGEVQVIRGKPLFRTDATVHSKWKIRRNQEVLVYEKIDAEQKYEIYSYSDGSYEGCVVKVFHNGKCIFNYSGGRYTLKVLNNLKLAAVCKDACVFEIIKAKFV